ncbi:MAG: isochorismatase family protein [Desulfopila sp.]|nr:isochorismatase family protein [Desulfopila sp.]
MDGYALLKPSDCCLHIIDPQKSLMAQIHEAKRVTRVIRLMLACSAVMGIPVLASTQYRKGLGPYVDELEDALGAIPQFDKVEFSAYENAATLEAFSSLPGKISTVIMVGVETHICIYQSAAGALRKGLTPWIVADGVSARTPVNHELGLERLRSLGAIVGPAEMIIYELLGRAGTDEFKKVLPHIIEFNKAMK